MTCLSKPAAGGRGAADLRTLPVVSDRSAAAREEEVAGPDGLPVAAEDGQEPRREHDVAVLPALALADADDHAAAVDVLDAEAGDLGEPQPGGIGGHEQGAVLEVGDGGEEAGQLVEAEDDRELPGLLGAGDALDDPSRPRVVR